MVPWVNAHGAWIAGLAWLGLVCAGETGLLLLKRKNAPGKPIVRLLWGGLALAFLATIVNPYGLHIWRVPFELSRSPGVTRVVAEWKTPGLAHWLDPRHVGAWLLPIAFILAPRRPRPADWLILLFFGVLALTARRHVALTLLVTAPAVAGQFEVLLHRFAGRANRKGEEGRPVRTIVSVAVTCAVLVVVALGGVSLPRAGVGLSAEKYPIGGADFIKSKNLEGNLFNSYAFGNYLLFALYPDSHVFIDGRVDMYGETPVELYGRVRRADPDWRDILKQYGIEVCVLQTNRDPPAPLIPALHAARDWALVYWDDNAAVYVQRTARREAFLKSNYVYAVHPIMPDSDRVKTAAGLARARADYLHKLEEDVDCARAVEGLGFVGSWLLETGKPEEAEPLFRKMLALGRHQAKAYRALGVIEHGKGKLDAALDAFENALRHEPDSWMTLWNLSQIQEQRGDIAEAIGAMESFIRLKPDDASARKRLDALRARQRGTPP